MADDEVVLATFSALLRPASYLRDVAHVFESGSFAVALTAEIELDEAKLEL